MGEQLVSVEFQEQPDGWFFTMPAGLPYGPYVTMPVGHPFGPYPSLAAAKTAAKDKIESALVDQVKSLLNL